MDSKSGLILLIVLGAGLIIFLVVFFVAIWLNYKSKLKATREKQKQLNLEVEDYLANNNFNITAKLYVDDNATFDQSSDSKKRVYIDGDNKQVCLIDYQRNEYFIAKFGEILNYELYENGNNVTTGIGGGAGSALGGIGVGVALSKSVSNKSYKQIDLIIRLKRYETSQIVYNVISNTYLNSGVYQCDDVYKKCIESLQKLISFLEVVINENNAKINQ